MSTESSEELERELKEKLSKLSQVLKGLIQPGIEFLTAVLPTVIEWSRRAYEFYKCLPVNVASFVVGFVLCFFGGMYPVLFAAIQAAKVGGWSTMTGALSDLTNEALVVLEASKKDDKLDDDKDGVADVKQIDEKQLLLRKANLVLTKINPQKVDQALTSLYTVWVAVIATLTVEFAKTIAFSVSIVSFIRKPADRILVPALCAFIPKEYHRWIPVVLGWTIKSIAMSIAWYIQTIMSAVSSAMTGGLVMSRALLAIAIDKKMDLGGFIKQNHADTRLDEIMSFVFAAIGFYFQFKLGFDVPFPFNLLLWPCEVAEDYLRWTITVVD